MVKTLSGLTNLTVADTLKLKKVSANGTVGTAGQVLHSNGSATYWDADDQGVTSVATGNGMTGGTITTTGTVSVVANTGIVANATGVFVNATYIGTLSANNASYLGGTLAANYVQNTDSRTLSGNINFTAANTFFNAGLTANGDIKIGTASSTETSGVGYQRFFSKIVNAGELYRLCKYNDAEGTVQLMITVSCETVGNSGTSIYLWQGGYASLSGANGWHRLLPLNVGRGHGDGPDTGENSNAWNVLIYAAPITGSAYEYGVAVSVPAGRAGKGLKVTVTELKRGMTFTDESSIGVVTSWTIDGTIYSHRNLLVEGNVGIGNTAPAFKLRVDGTTSLAGAVSDITTLAAGNTSITGFANVTTSVNSALLTVGTSFIANTTGAYHTGTVNAASHTVGTVFIANATQLTTTVPFSANGGVGSAGQILTSNGATGSPYWATPSVNTAAAYTWTNTNVFQNTVAITGGFTVNSSFTANGSLGSAGQVLVTSGAGNVYWASVSGLSGGVNTAAQFTWTNSHVFQNTVAITGGLIVNSSFTANGSLGSAGQVLVTAGSGNVYWAAVSALSGGVNTASAYTWTNTHTFQNTITFSSLVNAAAINVTGQVNTATLYATTSANIASAVQANATGVWTTGIVNAASHTVGAAFIANSTAIVVTGYANVTTSVNSALLTVGTAFTANSTLVNAASLVVSTNTATIGSTAYFVAGGNVGIGNTAPNAKLQVTGTANVSGNVAFGDLLTLNNNKALRFNTVNTSASAYFIQQNDDNFVFYTTDASYGQRAVFSIFANNNTANLKFVAQTTFNGNVDLNIVAVYANGTPGTAGQILTTNGQSTYWASPGVVSVNTAAQYSWTNTHTFSANVSFTGNGIGIATNTGAIYLGGISDANWKIGRNTGVVTKWRYTNNTIDIVTANSNLEGMSIGLASGSSYFETGYLGTFIAGNVTVGNTSSNSTINSTGFAFGTSFIANTTGAYHTGTVNAASFTVGTAFTANSTVVNAVSLVVSTNTATIGTAAYFVSNGNVGIGTNSPTSPLHVSSATFPVARIDRTSSLTAGSRSSFTSVHRTTGDMTDSFGTDISFIIRDSSNVDNEIANFGAYRDGADNSGTLIFATYNAGTFGTKMYIKPNGNVGIGNAVPTHLLSVNGTGYFNANLTINAALIANGGAGSAGEVLHSNGTATYWAADDNTTYDLLTVANVAANEARVRLKDSANANDDVLIIGANGITTFSNSTAGYAYAVGSSTVTVNAAGIHVNPVLSITDLTVSGNLSVLGDTVTLNVASIAIEDSLVEFARNQDDTATFTDALDIGIYGSYGNTSNSWSTGLFRDQSDSGVWKIFQSNGIVTNTNINTTNASLYGLAPLRASSFGTTETGYGSATGGAISNATIIAVGNSTANVVAGYGTFNLNNNLVANSTGVYHTGTVNAASHTVGTSFTANSTLVNAVSLVVSTNTATIGTAAYFVSNGNVGIGTASPSEKLHVYGSSSIFLKAQSTTTAGAGLWTENSTGWYKWQIDSTRAFSLTDSAGPNRMFVANNGNIGLGDFSISTSGAAYAPKAKLDVIGSLSVGYALTDTFSAPGNSLVVSGNVGIGNTAPAFKLRVDGTTSLAGAVSDITTLAAGNTSITGFVNATSSVNTAQYTIGTTLIANTLGIYHTGTVNAASHTVGSSFIANSTAIVGTGYANVTTSVNSALLTVGTAFIANTTGAYHTGTINAASHTTTGVTANVTGVYPTSNTSGTELGSSTQRWVINANTINGTGDWTTTGNVGIGIAASATYRLQVNGSFAATTKSFVIDHPTKQDMKLRYGSLEGPENGVYVRGRANTNKIELPDYWTGLINQDSITVNLTPIGKKQDLYVKDVSISSIVIGGSRSLDYYYTVFAERKDVEKLVVEF